MPRKKRQVKQDLRRAGFVEDRKRSKGSHSYWYHPRFPDISVTIAGHDGDDAKPYDEDNAAKAIAAFEHRVGLS